MNARTRIAGLVAALLVGAATISSAENPERAPAITNNIPPPPAELWFEVGEEVLYDIYWGFINVGHSHSTTSWVEEGGRKLLKIRFESRSNNVIASIYPVEDIQEVLIDPVTFLPVMYSKDSKQGRKLYKEVIRFDHSAGMAHYESILKGTQKQVPIEADTRDLISLMFLIRTMQHEPGNEIQTKVFTEDKIYDLIVKITRKEKVELDKYGDVASMVFEPEAAFDGLFVRKGKVTLWVSDDHRKLCTRITARVPVANIRIELAEVRGPGQDFWVGKKSPGSVTDIPMRAR